MVEKTLQFHAKHKAPKLETLEKGGFYAITLSPEDIRDKETYKVPNNIQVLEDFRTKYRDIENILKTKLGGSYVELYPEFSPTGRLHFHGVINITDLFTFSYHDLFIFQKLGMYEIDTMDDIPKWTLYMGKQAHIFKPICDKLNIDYPLMTKKKA